MPDAPAADSPHMRRLHLRPAAYLAAVICLSGLLVPLRPAPAHAGSYSGPLPVLCSSLGQDWNGLNNVPNTWRAVWQGRVIMDKRPAYDLNGSGTAVAWAANPYASEQWRRWLLSLKWVGSLVNRGTGRWDTTDGWGTPAGRKGAIDKAVSYVRDYVLHVPVGRFGGTERSNVHHRVHAMACVLDAWTRVYASLDLPAPDTGWLRSAIRAQVAVLRGAYRGAWNQGLDDAQAVMTASCAMRDAELRAWASARYLELADQTIDSEGVTTEQSIGYSRYLRSRWDLITSRASACGYELPAELTRKLDLVSQYVTHGTRPDGRFAQIGDTYAGAPTARPTAGLPLARTYRAGWAFARSSWTRSASYLTMRYGLPRTYHGHFDHTALTFWARGHEVIADSGHVGYDSRSRRDYIWSPQAHSLVTASADWIRGPNRTDSAALTMFAPSATGVRMRVVDHGFASIRRDRYVSVDYTRNALLAVDRVRSERTGRVSYAQRWVLPAGWSVAKVSRTKFVAARGHERITIQRVPIGTQASRTGAGQPFGPSGATILRSYAGIDPGVVRSNRHVVFFDNAARSTFVTVVIAHPDTQSAWAAPHQQRANCVRVGVGASRLSMCY